MPQPRGRPRHKATERVRALLEDGASAMAVQRALAADGVAISRRTIHRIRDGESRAGSLALAAGERRLAQPLRCGGRCGGRISIVPCRLDGWRPDG